MKKNAHTILRAVCRPLKVEISRFLTTNFQQNLQKKPIFGCKNIFFLIFKRHFCSSPKLVTKNGLEAEKNGKIRNLWIHL